MIFVKSNEKEIEAKKNLYIEQNKVEFSSSGNKKTPLLFTVTELNNFFL